MSKPAWEYLTTHLPEIRQAVLPNTGSKIGEPGLALLLYLSGQTNPQGEFFMTAKTMQEETGLATLRQVEKLLAGFVALGWITPTGETNRYMNRGRPTPVYVLTLFPQYARLFAQTLNKSEEIPSGGTVEELSKANRQKDYKNFRQIEPEPEPEPDSEPEPRSVVSESARQEKAGIFADEVLTICIELETEDMALRGEPILPGLVKRWKAEYPSLIADAIGKGHNDTAENVAEYCHNVRTEARTGRPATGAYRNYLPRPAQVTNAPKRLCGRCGNKNRDIPGHVGRSTQYDLDPVTGSYVYTTCKQCNGTGYKELEPSPADDYFPTDEPADDYFHDEPTHEPTHERVSTDQDAYTYIHTPGGSADPQSGARNIRDIEKGLLLRLTKPIKPLPD
jgi:hypothetical protein